ncbi:LysR family transcriptional regulator substrate-binding protein, partial [Nocardia brasiliensis]|uniref:LysR family transcriptional regulator substrate-binding protein n=1 Tax=Nocardia brasiliensis TaxID=37326 RepID=UPI002454F5D2
MFGSRFPSCATEVIEIPLADPFGPVQRGEVDIAVVLLPMGESELVLGQVFSEQPQMLAMHRDHPLASRGSLSAEDLAEFALIGVRGPAPQYWRRAQALDVTPGGGPVAPGPPGGPRGVGVEGVGAGAGAVVVWPPPAG